MCLDRSLREEAATLLTHDAPVEFRDGHLVKDLLRSRNLEPLCEYQQLKLHRRLCSVAGHSIVSELAASRVGSSSEMGA